ncbi:MAG: alkaline phosphatase [Henriciella sp.]
MRFFVKLCMGLGVMAGIGYAAFSAGWIFVAPTPGYVVQQANDSYYEQAERAVSARITDDFVPSAKNVIIMIGDGMGVSTITAARIYAGQRRGLDGESYKLTMEQFPHMALARTYSHDFQVSESASTATAIISGVKTRSRLIGLRQDAALGNCATVAGQGTDSLFDLAEWRGRSTGLVSTARITHATPAAAYAETPDRSWEASIPDKREPAGDCRDIADQLVNWSEGDGFEIVMGGGRTNFIPQNLADPEYPEKLGKRLDGRNLVAEWEGKSPAHKVILDGDEFAAADFSSSDRIFGLFEPSHMRYDFDRSADPGAEPSLEDMTRAAIARLSQDPDGFVLMVEGGRIDHAHHAVNAARALGDTDAFDRAVSAALDMTDPAETLIIVTADHSHTMTIAGYPRRNNPILGLVESGPGVVSRALDSKPYTTLSYANGISACRSSPEGMNCERRDHTETDTTDQDFRQDAVVPVQWETHAGEDVPVFASGPGSELVRGIIDQNEIFHIMAYASGLVDPVRE